MIGFNANGKNFIIADNGETFCNDVDVLKDTKDANGDNINIRDIKELKETCICNTEKSEE